MTLHNPRLAIARHVALRARRGAAIWGVVFGLFVIATIKGFVVAYPTLKQRVEVAHSLQSFAILLGVPHRAETVAGFTMWRVLTAIAVIGAIWGLLTSSGLLRGEEDAGRWELFLASPTTKRWATAQALLGLGAALIAMFVPTALITVAAGYLPGARFTVGGSLLFAITLVAGAAMFLAIGALASQLSASRGQAAMIAGVVLGVAFVIRMVADSSRALGWMRWLSPIGWLEEVRPLHGAQPLALGPVAALILMCAGLTVLLAGRRDLNASILRESEGHLHDTRWLLGSISLAVRLSRGTALGWLAGVAGFSAMMGSLARSASGLLTSSPTAMAALGRLGLRQATDAYMGMAFFMIAVIIAVIAAGQIAAIHDEEASGRLEHLLVRPVRRIAWLAGRMAVSLSLLVGAGLAAGLFTWAGAASRHSAMDQAKLLAAGINAALPAVFVLGAGALVLGFRPRLSSIAAYGIVAWSFLVDLLGSFIKGADWLRDSSLFTHIALAPAAKPDWAAGAIIVALGLSAALIGALAFQRRDIEYG